MKFITYREKRNKEGRLIRLYQIYNFLFFKIKKKVLPILGDNNKIIIGGREITQEEKKLLDKYGKITIEGNNNIVELPTTDDLSCDFRIEGNNNTIHIGMREESIKEIKKSDNAAKLIIDGNYNVIHLSDIHNLMCDGNIVGNNNKINIGKFERETKLSFNFRTNYNNRELYIDNMEFIVDCTFIVYGNNRKIHVGKNCLFSWGIFIKTTDQHPFYDLETNKRLNEEEDVIIGDHVWLGQDVYVSKGSVIPSGCIVGAKSFVNKAFTKENCVIAGVPAKVIKEKIYWNYK